MTTMTFGPAIDEEQFLINIAFQLVDDFPALFDSVTYYSAAAHALVVKSQVNAVPVLTDIVITEGSSQPTGSATYNINATLGMTDLFIAGDRINLKIDGTPMITVVYSVSHQDTQYAIGAQCATQFPTKIDYGNSDDDLHLTLIGEGKTVAFVVTDYTVTGA